MQRDAPEPPQPDEPRFHKWVWIVYAFLLAISIPWYFPRGGTEPIWLGFPRWVTVSITADVLLAVFTAFVIHRYWGEDDRPPPRGYGEPGRSPEGEGRS